MTDDRQSRRDMQRLRRRFAQLRGAEPGQPASARGMAGRLRRTYRRLYWRATSAAKARQATGELGPEVERLWGVPLARQLRQQVSLALRFGFDAEMYYRYRLYLLDDLRDAVLFVPFQTNIALRCRLRKLLDYDGSINDKREFAARCREAGLPTVPLVAEFDGDDVTWGSAAVEAGRTGDRLPARDLFSKPASGQGGAGAARWVWDDGAGYVGEDDVAFSPAALVDHLRAHSRAHPQVLQPRLVNVSGLHELGMGALCTARITTAQVPGHDPEVVESYVRMSTRDVPVDNFAQGGLAAPVNAATGVLGPGIRKELACAAQDYDVHPTTGHPITGFQVPQWPEAVALAKRAHEAIAEAPMVGWDIAITTDGVLLLEANTAPSAHGQQPGCRPYGATPYVRVYLAGLDPPRPPVAPSSPASDGSSRLPSGADPTPSEPLVASP